MPLPPLYGNLENYEPYTEDARNLRLRGRDEVNLAGRFIMFCPKCSQQQASDHMRFCSRCGFPLGVVANLIAHDGVLIEARENVEEVRLTPRQKGVREGAWFLLVSLVVGFFISLLSVFVIGRPELFVSVIAGTFFLCGILRIAYAYMFEQDALNGKRVSEQVQLGRSAGDYALPPIQSIPATSGNAEGMNTAEMVSSPSVTEHTTKLLDKE